MILRSELAGGGTERYDIGRRDAIHRAGLFGPLPVGDGDAIGNGYARQMLYLVDCAADQDTLFTVANLESQNDVTVQIEYFLNDTSIFTQANTIRPGRIVKLSAAHGLAQSY